MQNAKVLSEKEVRECIAEKYHVPANCISRLKYSYVILDEKEKESEAKKNNVHS